MPYIKLPPANLKPLNVKQKVKQKMMDKLQRKLDHHLNKYSKYEQQLNVLKSLK